jgi:mono/diheme cytochrome c family protein
MKKRIAACAVGFAAALLLLTAPAAAQQPAEYFRQNCMSCHTIGGGRLTGPDLQGVVEREDREWLIRFIQNPKAMIDAGDPRARQLLEEFRGVVMPTAPGMTREMAEAMVALIEAESQLEQSQFAGVAISDRPFNAFDISEGRKVFLGLRPLKNEGASCVACHTVGTLEGLGGGLLGPELTGVYERLGDRNAVGTWLSAPATPTMQALYRDKPLDADEIFALLAFLDDADKRSAAVAGPSPVFLLLGLLGTVVALAMLNAIWRSRFRSVRRALVAASPRSHR